MLIIGNLLDSEREREGEGVEGADPAGETLTPKIFKCLHPSPPQIKRSHCSPEKQLAHGKTMIVSANCQDHLLCPILCQV